MEEPKLLPPKKEKVEPSNIESLSTEIAPNIFVGPDGYYVKFARFESDLLHALGPFLHKKILRKSWDQQPTLPMKLRMPIWPHLGEIFRHRHNGQLMLQSGEEVSAFLGAFQKKTFERASYALITPPLTIKMGKTNEELIILLNYAVYNKSHTLQWPLHFN